MTSPLIGRHLQSAIEREGHGSKIKGSSYIKQGSYTGEGPQLATKEAQCGPRVCYNVWSLALIR